MSFLSKMVCGTYEYMSLEVLKGEPYEKSADIWSLGILIFELFHNREPFMGATSHEVANSILSTGLSLSFEYHVPHSAKNLIKKILRIQKEARPDLRSIIKSNFFRGYPQYIEPANQGLISMSNYTIESEDTVLSNSSAAHRDRITPGSFHGDRTLAEEIAALIQPKSATLKTTKTIERAKIGKNPSRMMEAGVIFHGGKNRDCEKITVRGVKDNTSSIVIPSIQAKKMMKKSTAGNPKKTNSNLQNLITSVQVSKESLPSLNKPLPRPSDNGAKTNKSGLRSPPKSPLKEPGSSRNISKMSMVNKGPNQSRLAMMQSKGITNTPTTAALESETNSLSNTALSRQQLKSGSHRLINVEVNQMTCGVQLGKQYQSPTLSGPKKEGNLGRFTNLGEKNGKIGLKKQTFVHKTKTDYKPNKTSYNPQGNVVTLKTTTTTTTGNPALNLFEKKIQPSPVYVNNKKSGNPTTKTTTTTTRITSNSGADKFNKYYSNQVYTVSPSQLVTQKSPLREAARLFGATTTIQNRESSRGRFGFRDEIMKKSLEPHSKLIKEAAGNHSKYTRKAMMDAGSGMTERVLEFNSSVLHKPKSGPGNNDLLKKGGNGGKPSQTGLAGVGKPKGYFTTVGGIQMKTQRSQIINQPHGIKIVGYGRGKYKKLEQGASPQKNAQMTRMSIKADSRSSSNDKTSPRVTRIGPNARISHHLQKGVSTQNQPKRVQVMFDKVNLDHSGTPQRVTNIRSSRSIKKRNPSHGGRAALIRASPGYRASSINREYGSSRRANRLKGQPRGLISSMRNVKIGQGSAAGGNLKSPGVLRVPLGEGNIERSNSRTRTMILSIPRRQAQVSSDKLNIKGRAARNKPTGRIAHNHRLSGSGEEEELAYYRFPKVKASLARMSEGAALKDIKKLIAYKKVDSQKGSFVMKRK